MKEGDAALETGIERRRHERAFKKDGREQYLEKCGVAGSTGGVFETRVSVLRESRQR